MMNENSRFNYTEIWKVKMVPEQKFSLQFQAKNNMINLNMS